MSNLLEEMTQTLINSYADKVNEQMFGGRKPIRYDKKVVTRYLSIPYLSIAKDYDNDYEYGSGEFRGLLLSIQWFQTKIPVGKKTIEIPIYRETTGQTVTWKRYSKLDPKSKEEQGGTW